MEGRYLEPQINLSLAKKYINRYDVYKTHCLRKPTAYQYPALHKKWSFPLRIFSVIIANGKLHFLCSAVNGY